MCYHMHLAEELFCHAHQSEYCKCLGKSSTVGQATRTMTFQSLGCPSMQLFATFHVSSLLLRQGRLLKPTIQLGRYVNLKKAKLIASQDHKILSSMLQMPIIGGSNKI